MANDPEESNLTEDPSEAAREEAAMAAYRDAHYRRRRFRILMGIALLIVLVYALR